MPTYEYECQTCHERLEAVQKFSDPSLTACPLCAGDLRKVFSAVGIVFKGSGFYKNDSRDKKSSTTSATASSAATPSTPEPSTAPTSPTPSAPSTPSPSASSSASSD